MNNQTIEIEMSKGRMILLLLLSLLFVAGGVFVFMIADEQDRRSPELMKIIGVLCSLIFAAASIFWIKRMNEEKVGLTIDDLGFDDQTNASSVGRVNWEDVTGFRQGRVSSTRFILVDLKDPEKYLEGLTGIRARLAKGTYKQHGTAVSIVCTALKWKHKEVLQLLESKFEDYLNSNS